MAHEPVIAIDIDDTVYDYDGYIFQQWGPLKEGARVGLEKLKSAGLRLMAFTSRCDIEYDALVARLEQDNILQFFDRIQFGKPVCDAYLDDRGIRFTDWINAPTDVKELLVQKGRNI